MQINLNLKGIGRGILAVFKLDRLAKIAVISFCSLGASVMGVSLLAETPPVEATTHSGFGYPPQVIEVILTVAPKVYSCWQNREKRYIWQWQFGNQGVIGGCIQLEEETEL